MRRPVRIERRFVAVIGAIALVFAYLPGVVSILSANPLPTCCAGALCPMHNMAGGHMTCGMDMSHPGTTCEACPCHAPQYTVGLIFNRVAPPVFASERPTGAAPVLHLIAPPSIEPEVVSPPPRLTLS
jgi:hypothetical protein